MNDSPVGLAAYILEKFSTWTDLEYRRLDDGGLERYREFGHRFHLKRFFLDTSCFPPPPHRKFTLDDLLTNVMIYWTTRSIVPSMRFYKENLKGNLNNRVDARYVAFRLARVRIFRLRKDKG